MLYLTKDLKIVLADYTTGIVKIGFGNIGIFDSKYDRTVIEFCDKSKIEFRGSASVGHGSKISVQSNGELILGKNFCITANSTIICTKKIIFGTDCLLSWDILIMDSDLHQISDNLNSVLNSPNPVIIGNHVWIGAKTTILKGTEISEGCVVGANSLVSNVFKELNTLIAGVPSEVIKSNISWKR